MAIATTAFAVFPQPKSLPWIECFASPPLAGVKQQEVKAGVLTPEKFSSNRLSMLRFQASKSAPFCKAQAWKENGKPAWKQHGKTGCSGCAIKEQMKTMRTARTKPSVPEIILLAFCCVLAHSAIAQTVTVTAPNGGENWTAGTTHSITWSGTGSSANMAYYKIALSTDGGVTWPAAGTANDLTPDGIYDPAARSFSWTIGSALNTTQARIRVRPLDSGGNILITDTSDANFTISPPVVLPTVTVIAPNGSENWTAGTTHSITWSGTGSSANMAYYKIALSTDGGVTWPAAGTANDLTPNGLYDPAARSFSWTIGSSLNTTQARIRVRALDSGGNILVADTSDANFTISPPVVLPTVTMIAQH